MLKRAPVPAAIKGIPTLRAKQLEEAPGRDVAEHRQQLISVALLKCGSVVHVLAPDFVELRPAILFMQASNDKLLTRQLLEGYVAAVQITQQ